MLKKCVFSSLSALNIRAISNIINKDKATIKRTDEDILKQKYESYSQNLVIRPAKGFMWGAGSKVLINSDKGVSITRIFHTGQGTYS
jgi:hypothetical protein